MEKVIQYKCDDGTFFTSEIDALRHENNWLRTVAVPKVSKSDIQTVKDALLNSVPITSGVYMWTNIHDNFKKYVGSSVCLQDRAKLFLNFTKNYGGVRIDEARKKYADVTHWSFTVLKICNETELEKWENHFIQEFNSRIEGYNTNVATRKPATISPMRLENVISNAKIPMPTNVATLYRKFKIGMKGRYFHDEEGFNKIMEILTIENFYEAIKNFDHILINPNRHFSFTFNIKAAISKIDDIENFKNLSTVGQKTYKFICGGEKIYMDNDGMPSNICKYIPLQNCYMYSFTCAYGTQAPLIQTGFSTKKKCFEAYLSARLQILKELAELERSSFDNETFEIINSLTLSEAEHLFFPHKKVFVFDENEEVA